MTHVNVGFVFAQSTAGPASATGQPGPQPPPAVITLKEAIQRAVEHHLTVVGLTHAVGQARGQQQVARSALLPGLTGEFSALGQRLNLAAQGVQFEIPVPGFVAEDVVGPFSVFDLRARVSHPLVNLTARRSHDAAGELLRARELSLEDARDLIALVVARSYLEALAARARVDATRSQIDTASAVRERTRQQQAAGLATPLDLSRAEVQTLTVRQRLTALEGAFAKQKIDLARLAGWSPTDQYDLDRSMPFSGPPPMAFEDALGEALSRRSDLAAAEAQLRAAEFAVAAARAERMPSVSLFGDYGASRAAGRPVANTYMVGGVIRVQLWEGGRIDGQIAQAVSELNRRRAERDDLRAQVTADLRKTYVDLAATESQVQVSDSHARLTREMLALSRQRFEAGLGDNVTLVQSQELVASAEFDHINSILSHNVAKLDLARALGRASGDLTPFLRWP